jgi:hypothetical protein
MEKPSWEANSSSANQEMSHTLWNPMVQYHIHKSPNVSLSSARSIQSIPHTTSWRSTLILVLSSHLHTGIPSGPFPSGFPTKTLSATLYLPKCATTIPFAIWSSKIYVTRCTDHIALLYAVFSIALLPCPSDPKITKYA